MNIDELALAAVDLWGGAVATPRLINQRENAVFEVTLNSGQRGALRLHRVGYHSKAEILSELIWTEGLSKRGFPVPEPVASTTGALVEEMSGGQFVTLIKWVDGSPIGESEVPLNGTLDDQISLYKDVGETLALMHKLTDEIVFPDDFTREKWDRDGLVGDSPLWGKYWQHKALTQEESTLLLVARDKARAVLDGIKDLDYGLVHADALRENVFKGPAGLTLIDYDDSGFGYRMYDLTTSLTQSLDDDNYDDLRTAIIDGYSRIRPLSDRDANLFLMFSMLRTFSSVGWTMPRMTADNPKNAKYIARAIRLARQFLNENV